MQAYHFTQYGSYPDMMGALEAGEPMKKRPLLRQAAHAANEQGVFALLEPEVWKNNPSFPEMWTYMRKYFGSLLLTLDIDPERCLVHDWAPMERFIRPGCAIHKEPRHTNLGRAFGVYLATRMRLSDYLSTGAAYELPEVFIPDDVGWEAVTMSPVQPELDADPDITEEDRTKFADMLRRTNDGKPVRKLS